jgi:hypothetical protein
MNVNLENVGSKSGSTKKSHIRLEITLHSIRKNANCNVSGSVKDDITLSSVKTKISRLYS